MVAKRKASSQKTTTLPILLVGESAAGLDRKQALLHQAGFEVTRAENICYAELYSETQFFEAAVYDESLSPQEQVSLARVMRVRWPWMRLIRCGHEPIVITDDDLFTCSVASEAELPAMVLQSLSL